MKLLGKNVLLTEVEKETKTAGGILLTGEVSKAVKPGLVLAVGIDAAAIPVGKRVYVEWTGDLVVDIPVGRRVYVAWDGAMPIDFEGKRACIVTADKIKAVLAE